MIPVEDRDQWLIYRGDGEPHDRIADLPPPPPWRRFDGRVRDEPVRSEQVSAGARLNANDRARVYFPSHDVVDMVNAALYLRRPLLVTGKPGTGKSALAYNVAYELGLGPVLNWAVTSRSSLQDALYRYDAIGRLHEASLARGEESLDVGRYIRLGPVGTALVPGGRPRVLLIDELDKSDVNLPNDLLNAFEEGQFDIPELMRLPDEQAEISVMTADADRRVTVSRGQVRCAEFPFVVITSNGEREFPPPFLRRCLRLNMHPPGAEKLSAIVAGHLGEPVLAESEQLIQQFMESRDYGDLATDQLLNAIYLLTAGSRPLGASRERMVASLFRPLDNPAG
jgi:MoxR-like ATPase